MTDRPVEADWVGWHAQYDAPNARLVARLHTVQRRLADALDAAPPGPIRVVSMCAGQGRDVLGVLPDHPRRHDVVATLVELDPVNAAAARAAVDAARLGERVDVIEADAAQTNVYREAVPADVVLACGIFGNISDEDVERTVAHLPRFCAPRATVIWTRHRAEPDLTPSVRRWFADAGFEEVAFDAPPDVHWSVGTHVLAGRPLPWRNDVHLFTFVKTGPR